MTVLTVLEYPDPRLRTKASPVAVVDDNPYGAWSTICSKPCTSAPGHRSGRHPGRCPPAHPGPRYLGNRERPADCALINPEIHRTGRHPRCYEEGCLSVPGHHRDGTNGPEQIRVSGAGSGRRSDSSSRPKACSAICIQHEMDHLEGKLFVDYLSELKRLRIKKKALKQRKRIPVSGRMSTPAI